MKRKQIPQSIREIVYKKYNGICAYCLIELKKENFVVDHILSFAMGGKDEINNYALACRPCNSRKWGSMSDEEIILYNEGLMLKKISKKIGKSYREIHRVFLYNTFYKNSWPTKWPFENNELKTIC